MSVKMYANFEGVIKGGDLSNLLDEDDCIDLNAWCGDETDIEDLSTSGVQMSGGEGKFTGSIIVRTDDRDCLSHLELWCDSDVCTVTITELTVTDVK